MKIDLAIHASDSNPFYLDFWPLVSKLWKELFNIEPLLVYIDENHEIPIDTTYGTVVKLKPVKDVPLYLQCQWVRYWIPTQYPDKVCMTCDIDMLPISRNYFIKQLESIDNDKYVHLNSTHDVLPCCYNAAKGSIFKKVLNLPDTWENSIRHLYSLNLGRDHYRGFRDEILKGKVNWGAEEQYADNLIRNYSNKDELVFLERHHLRIDRMDWSYDPFNIIKDKYADAHCVRPYSDPYNKMLIDKLIYEINVSINTNRMN